MRIWFQKHVPVGHDPMLDRGYEEHAKKVLRPDTTVHYQGLPEPGIGKRHPADMVKYAVSEMLFGNHFLSRAIEAEKAGYDAFIVGTATDPALRETKTVVDIPVVAYSETSLHFAAMVGNCISYVGFNEGIQGRLADNARMYGFGDRLGPFGLLRMTTDQVHEAFAGKTAPFIDGFHKVAREVIARGANVLIANEGLTNELLFHAGVFEIDGVPIIDSNGLVLKMAEFMVEMRRVSGLKLSRNGHYYAKPSPELLAILQDSFGAR